MDRLAHLKSLLKAREGRKGYADNVKQIKREIAQLEAENAG